MPTLCSETGTMQPEKDSSKKAHPSQDTGNASVWYGFWGGLLLPCMTATPLSRPSRMKTGRRNEGMQQLGCIRPATEEDSIIETCQWRHLGSMRRDSDLIPRLSLSNQNQGVGGDDGKAEVNEDHRALGPNIPAGRSTKLWRLTQDDASMESNQMWGYAMVLPPDRHINDDEQQQSEWGNSTTHDQGHRWELSLIHVLKKAMENKEA